MHSDADILEAIRQDPIADAERVMGKTVDESKVVQGMALDLQFRKAAALKHMLEETHDLERLGQLPDFVKKAINFESYCARA